MVNTHISVYPDNLMAIRASSSCNQRVPLTPKREYCPSALMASVVNALPEQPEDSPGENMIMVSLLQQADRVYPGGLAMNKQKDNAEFF